MAEEYEILPHQLLSDLKYEVEALKKKLTQPDAKANELILEIESLKDSIHELTNVFQRAMEDIKGSNGTDNAIKKIVEQNETIAKGMIAISDKLEDFMQNQGKGSSSQHSRPLAPVIREPMGSSGMQRHTMGMPQEASRMAPRPNMMPPSRPRPQAGGFSDLPPPPPGGSKKKGLFS